MAREIIISFISKNLDKARENLKAMQATARDLVKQIKDPDVRRFAKKDLAKEQRQEKLDLQADERANERRLDALRRRGAELNPNGGGTDVLGDVFGAARTGKQIVRAEEGSIRALASLLGGGAALGIGVIIFGLIKNQVEEAIKERTANNAALLEARLARLEFDTNITARNKDPVFEQEQSAKAFERLVEAEGRGKVWHGDDVIEIGGN